MGRAGRPAGSIGERLRVFNSASRSGVGCLEDSARRDARPVREATSVRRGRTARTIEARTTTGGIRLHNYVSASPVTAARIGELS